MKIPSFAAPAGQLSVTLRYPIPTCQVQDAVLPNAVCKPKAHHLRMSSFK